VQARELVERRELLWNLTLRELRTRYKKSTLGWLWSLLNPLSTMVIYTIVFVGFFDATAPLGVPSGLNGNGVYPLYLLAGLLPWSYFANTTSSGMAALLGNAGLIRKVYFPRELLVFSSTANLFVTHAIEMGLLSVAFLVAGNMVAPWLVPVVGVTALLTLFGTGIGLMLSVLNVYFRDLQHLWGIVTTLWFFLTPIVYPLDLVEDKLSGFTLTAYKANPTTQFVEAYRHLLYDLRWPPMSTIAYVTVVSCAVFALGLWVFARFDHHVIEEL
jgi:ABC-type polysaccharide/polyol phosphate export permease